MQEVEENEGNIVVFQVSCINYNFKTNQSLLNIASVKQCPAVPCTVISMCLHCVCLTSHSVHVPVFHRWPKCRPSGPSLRTRTILDHALSPTKPSRGNWSLPNMAASYSSGTGEAAPESQSPSKAMCSVQKQPDYFWPLIHEWHFKRFKSGADTSIYDAGFAPFICVWSEGWFWTGLMCTSSIVKQFDKGRKDGWMDDCVNKVHESIQLSWPLL